MDLLSAPLSRLARSRRVGRLGQGRRPILKKARNPALQLHGLRGASAIEFVQNGPKQTLVKGRPLEKLVELVNLQLAIRSRRHVIGSFPR